MRFNGRDFRRLILGRIKTVGISDKNLQRRQDQRHTEPHLDHDLRVFFLTLLQQIARPDTENNECGRQVGGNHHVGKPQREGRVENDLQPIFRVDNSIADNMPGGKLHPAVGRQDPEG